MAKSNIDVNIEARLVAENRRLKRAIRGAQKLFAEAGVPGYEPSAQKRRHKAPHGECNLCDEMRVRNDEFHPPHDASPHCESGGHTHCSCDTCF